MKRSIGGFTLVELMIATSIFSVVLLVALTGFFQIGKTYFKGVVTNQTQAAAQKIMDDMTNAMQFASTIKYPTSSPDPNNIVANRGYMCVGGTRYTYILYKQVGPGENPQNNNFGLLRDNAACGDPFNGGAALNNPTEMLGSKMRLSKICVRPADGSDLDVSGDKCPDPNVVKCIPGGATVCLNNLFLFNLVVTYGDDDILNLPSSSKVTCNGGLSNSQYCTVITLQSIVNKGYGN